MIFLGVREVVVVGASLPAVLELVRGVPLPCCANSNGQANGDPAIKQGEFREADTSRV